jgi:hypothetical protein
MSCLGREIVVDWGELVNVEEFFGLKPWIWFLLVVKVFILLLLYLLADQNLLFLLESRA